MPEDFWERSWKRDKDMDFLSYARPYYRLTSPETALFREHDIRTVCDAGCGYGLIISADTSTGGSDLLAAIVTRRWKFLTIGMVMNLLDFVVVTAGAFIDGISTLLPSIVAVLICNISIDVAAYGFGTEELPAWLSHILPGKSRRRKQPSRRIFRYFPYAAVMASVIIVVVRTYVITSGIFQASIL